MKLGRIESSEFSYYLSFLTYSHFIIKLTRLTTLSYFVD